MSDLVWNFCLARWRRGGYVWRLRVGWVRPDGFPWTHHIGRLTWTLFAVEEARS